MLFKKPKAQAGLEYLMTYGWALVIIVTVASALFFVLAPPQNQFICTSSDPTKILLESYNLPYSPNFSAGQGGPEVTCNTAIYSKCEVWGNPWAQNPDVPGKMVLRNATGGEIKIKSIAPWWGNAPAGACTYYWCFLGTSIPCDMGTSEATFNNTKYSLISQSAPLSVSGGQNIVIDNLVLSKKAFPGAAPNYCDPKNFSFSNPSFTLTYLDRSGYEKTVTITCSGYPPKT